uniref:Uncharacterized protein n=1 Tax=Peronospora matthiolae TaxID=2874970 RepID=A0AAV1TD02_9STRA
MLWVDKVLDNEVSAAAVGLLLQIEHRTKVVRDHVEAVRGKCDAYGCDGTDVLKDSNCTAGMRLKWPIQLQTWVTSAVFIYL